MNTISDFLGQFRIAVGNSLIIVTILEELEEFCGEDTWKHLNSRDLSVDQILGLRHMISVMFQQRLMGICTDALYNRIVKAHADAIFKFDELAWSIGFQITAKRECISSTEMMEEAGTVRVTGKGVQLTPLGHKIAEKLANQLADSQNIDPPKD